MRFSKITGRLSLEGPKILPFGSHSMAKFQSILDCSIANFKLKYEDLENIKTDRVATLAFNLHQIKRRAFFMGHPVLERFEIGLKLQEEIYFTERSMQNA